MWDIFIMNTSPSGIIRLLLAGRTRRQNLLYTVAQIRRYVLRWTIRINILIYTDVKYQSFSTRQDTCSLPKAKSIQKNGRPAGETASEPRDKI